MRAKKAKKLQAIAREMTVGHPDVAYATQSGVRKLDPRCTRWRYKQLKARSRGLSPVYRVSTRFVDSWG